MESKFLLVLLFTLHHLHSLKAEDLNTSEDEGYIEIKLNKDPSKVFSPTISPVPFVSTTTTEQPKTTTTTELPSLPLDSLTVDFPSFNDSIADPVETKWVISSPPVNLFRHEYNVQQPIQDDYGMQGVRIPPMPDVMWLKGKTESFVMSQSDGPTETYEVQPDTRVPVRTRRPHPPPSYGGPMGIFSSLFRTKPWTKMGGRKSKPRKVKPQYNSHNKGGGPPTPIRNHRRPPPPPKHPNDVLRRDGGLGRTPPNVMAFCLMNSERCSWSERDKRLFMVDDELGTWDTLPSKDTPPEVMHFCMRNSVSCHWSERDNRWYLIDITQKITE